MQLCIGIGKGYETRISVSSVRIRVRVRARSRARLSRTFVVDTGLSAVLLYLYTTTVVGEYR